MNVTNALQRPVVQAFTKEALAFIQANPLLLSSYTRIRDACVEKNWVVVLTEVTRILRDPSMKQVVYKQLKRIRDGLRDPGTKDAIQAMLGDSVEETDPETVALVRAGVEFLMTVGGMMDELKMRKVVYDICVEAGDCCKSFVAVVEQKKRKWGFFSGRK